MIVISVRKSMLLATSAVSVNQTNYNPIKQRVIFFDERAAEPFVVALTERLLCVVCDGRRAAGALMIRRVANRFL